MLERLVPFNGIECVCGAQAKSFAGGRLVVATADEERRIACDSAILCVGYREDNSLYEELKFDVPAPAIDRRGFSTWFCPVTVCARKT